MIDASTYSIEIRKGNFEGEICFQARVKEIPYLEEYADTYEDAYALVIDSIEATAALMEQQHKRMPEPIVPSADYSGRVTLRLPKTLHSYLSVAAEAEDVSLNTFLISILSDFRGFEVAHDVARKGYQSAAEKYGSMPGYVERRVTRKSNLQIVGSQHYLTAANAA